MFTEHLRKVAVLWGGGLGDLVVVNPFLRALRSRSGIESYLITTAIHVTEIHREFCAPTRVVILSRQLHELWRFVRKWRRVFDLIYLGRYPTTKTRILAKRPAPKQLWSRRHRDIDRFILEQVLCDTQLMDLDDGSISRDLPACLPWRMKSCGNPFRGGENFLVLHPGAKQQWETTIWPISD